MTFIDRIKLLMGFYLKTNVLLFYMFVLATLRTNLSLVSMAIGDYSFIRNAKPFRKH